MFQPAPTDREDDLTAVWLEDSPYVSTDPPNPADLAYSNENGVFQSGTPFVVEDSAKIVAPVAVNDNVTDYRNQAKTIDVLANDVEDSAYNLSSFVVASQPAHGTAAANADGSVTYTPTTGYVGPDSFEYKISDVNGLTSNLATVNITVAIPPAPTAANDTATTTRAIADDINVLANDTFPTPAVDSSVTVTTQPANGTAVVNTSDGSITYTPTGLFVGTDTFQYTVADTDGETSAPATVTVSVVKPAPPVAVNDSYPVVENSSKSLDVASNDTASTGTIVATTVSIVTGPADGTAVVQSNGDVLYTPTVGFTGTDTFTYVVDNNYGDVTNPATVTVTVVPSTPPTAVADTAQTGQNVPVAINVAANDTPSTDGGLDVTTIMVTTPPADGTAVLYTGAAETLAGGASVEPGDIIYTPNPTFVGTDTFSYTIGDGYGSPSTPATVSVTVTQAPAPTVNPTAPVMSTLSGTATTINASAGVTTTIPLAATSTTVTVAPLDGTAVADPTTGSIVYTPNAGFVGADTFTYTVQDIDGQTSAPVSESVFVGTLLSSARGASRSVSFADAALGKQTVSLNLGTAEVYFAGSGKVTTVRGKTSVIGTGLQISSISLAGTTSRSSLTISGSTKAPVNVGGISDAASLGAINAKSATLTGPVTLAGTSSIQFGSVAEGSITTTGSAATPLTFVVTNGTDGALTTSQTLRTFKAGTWNEGTNGIATITAPVISSLSIGSSFAGTVTAQTSAGSLVFRGGLTGTVVAGYTNLLEVVGSTTNATIDLTAAGKSANSVVVTGTMGGTNLSSGGSVKSISAQYLNDSVIEVGASIPASPATAFNSQGTDPLTVATAASLGTSTLTSLHITGRTTGGISNSAVLAGTITSASVGLIGVGNGGIPQGLAANHFGAFSGSAAGRGLRLGKAQLASETALTAYLKAKGFALGDYEIVIGGNPSTTIG